MTYGRLSKLVDGRLTPVGAGWAVRAGGDAIPWHRVVNSKGGVSTDGDHPGLQRAMLEKEGVVFDGDGRIDLDRYEYVPRVGK
jgi:methylated-DNA-protein-cysteine methyltransferase related protein